MPSYDKQGNMIISREEQLEQQLAQARKPKNMLEQAGDVAATVGKYALGAAGLTAAAYGLTRPGVREKIGSVGQKAMDFFNEARSERPGGVQMGDLSKMQSAKAPDLVLKNPEVATQLSLGVENTTPGKSLEAEGAAATQSRLQNVYQEMEDRARGASAQEEYAAKQPATKTSDFLKSQMAEAAPVVQKAVETAERVAPAQDDTPIYEAAEYAKGMMDKGLGRSQSRRQVAGRMQEAAEDNILKTGESVLSAFLAEEGYTVDDQATQAMDVDGYQEVKPHRQAAQRQGADLAQLDNKADTDLGTPNPRAADNDWERTGSMDPVENFDNPNPITDGETSTQPQKQSLATELRGAIAASNEADRKLGRLVGNYIDEQAKDIGRLREAIDPGVKASDDAVMRKAMMVSPSKMAASAVEDNRPDNVDRMLAATKPENMDQERRMETNPNVMVKGRVFVHGPGSTEAVSDYADPKKGFENYSRDLAHNINAELEQITGIPTTSRQDAAQVAKSAAKREPRDHLMYKGSLEGGSYPEPTIFKGTTQPSEAASRPVSPTQAMAEVANTPGASQGDIEQTAKQVGNALIEKTKKRRPGYYSQYGTSTSSMQ